ncbi:GntR family transcriptional regulator [Bosea sp. 62]|uniref:GntR family transcriptional regulator n=1 Tax=unclassified Bosea (in: a-proteobacteria) TaxID=2653178 RepID=UPI001254A8DC|nr:MULTISPECIES: GntR family transcriptional regulator [unclassified Bosea (in: a-proteobacteria)]CAD5251702.1 GntR family transcriptional regulator [Bosea sp. 21B]CAD5261614.1 GntR family transcriptional regulator [Bosea sp. 7B]CAD5273077.1 GntR family transcriptional regulator [Bosea sp. 46]VVT43469.1 GntR family transcriptional regulator [Bosea sp. EC-HK365B]VXB25886.1 GntR family transcriptional regulator [Bosea sp. 29B]
MDLQEPATGERRPETLGEGIFGRILELIYSTELAPGMVVNESVLATRFGVSRGPVREAIRRLQGIQLVSREPFLRARVVSLSAQAILELFQMREALEGYACRLAAQRMSETEIDALIADLEAAHSGRQPEGAHFDFHERVVRASGNSRIIDSLCGDLYHLLRIYRRISGAVPERKELAFTEHWQILRAIKMRDGALAESLMRSHVERAGRHVLAQVPETPSIAAADAEKRAS